MVSLLIVSRLIIIQDCPDAVIITQRPPTLRVLT